MKLTDLSGKVSKETNCLEWFSLEVSKLRNKCNALRNLATYCNIVMTTLLGWSLAQILVIGNNRYFGLQ